MNYSVKLLSNNRSFKTLNAGGMVVHETGNAGATAENHFTYWNRRYVGSSIHAVIDWQEVIQLVPYNEQAWHAGRTANGKYIGVELCRPTEHNPEEFAAVWQNAIDLFSDIFIEQLGITTVTIDNLRSHAEVSNQWHETDHQDPIAYFEEYGLTVDDFRGAVQNQIDIKIGKIQPEEPQPVEEEEQLMKITFVGDGKDIKVFAGDRELTSTGLIEKDGTTACMNIADVLREIGHEVEWKPSE